MRNLNFPGFRFTSEARLCRFSGPESRSDTPPPAVETGKKPDALGPSATESPEAAQKAAQKAAAERGAGSPEDTKALDKQIADARKQITDLAKDVNILRNEVKKQESIREKAKKNPEAAPAQSTETPAPAVAPVLAEPSSGTTTSESSQNSVSATPEESQSSETAAAETNADANQPANQDTSLAESALPAGNELASTLADEKPLSNEQFAKLQQTLSAKESALQSAQNNLQQLKDSRPEPKNIGEKANRVLTDAGDIMNDPNKSIGEKLVAGIQAVGALLAVWREAIGSLTDNLQQGADKVSGKEKDDANRQEHRAKLREEMKKSGKTPDAFIEDKAKQSRDIFSKPDPQIQEAMLTKNKLMSDKAKLKAEFDAATSKDKETIRTSAEAGIKEIDQKIAEAQKVIDEATKNRKDAAGPLDADVRELKEMKKAADSKSAEMNQKIIEMKSVLDNQRFPHLIGALNGISFSVDPGLEPQCKITPYGLFFLKALGEKYSVPLDMACDASGQAKDPMDVVKKMETLAQAVRTADADQKKAAKEKKV